MGTLYRWALETVSGLVVARSATYPVYEQPIRSAAPNAGPDRYLIKTCTGKAIEYLRPNPGRIAN
jgi:hypothetical protein